MATGIGSALRFAIAVRTSSTPSSQPMRHLDRVRERPLLHPRRLPVELEPARHPRRRRQSAFASTTCHRSVVGRKP